MNDTVYGRLRKFAAELTVPPGLEYPEISHGEIVMMMSPVKRHELAALRLRRQLDAQLPDGVVAHTGGDVEEQVLGILRRPDVIVIPESVLEEGDEQGIDPADVLLAAEIVSRSNPENDYVGKMRDYPAMRIPHYLIVDPRAGVVLHHWKPTGNGDDARYANTMEYAFGDIVTVGDWTVDTSVFLRYAAEGARGRSERE